MRILELAESLDVELGPGLPAYRVTDGEPAGVPASDQTVRLELAPPAQPALTAGDTRRTRRLRLLLGRRATLAG